MTLSQCILWELLSRAGRQGRDTTQVRTPGSFGSWSAEGGAGPDGRAGLLIHVCGEATEKGKRNPENRFSSLSCPCPYVKVPGLSKAGKPLRKSNLGAAPEPAPQSSLAQSADS